MAETQKRGRPLAESKRIAILAAARKNFLHCGYTLAGMTEIARDADVSTATLYKHFLSKEDLFRTVVEEETKFLRREFATPPEGATVAEKFIVSARLVLRSYRESDLHVLMRIVIAEVPCAPAVARSMFVSIVERWQKGVALLLDRLVEEGVLRPHDTRLSAMFLAGMVRQSFIWPGLFNADYEIPQNPDATIREMVELFLNRYGAAQAEGPAA